MIKRKDGQSLSLNTVIIAALGLIVLVVLIFIFSGKIKLFGKGTESCATQGGKCTKDGYLTTCIQAGSCECPESNSIYIQGTDCEKNSQICCKQVF